MLEANLRIRGDGSTPLNRGDAANYDGATSPIPSVTIVSDISEPLRDFGPLVDRLFPAPFSLVPSRYCSASVLVQGIDSAGFGSPLAFLSCWKTLTCSGSMVVKDAVKSVGGTVCNGDQKNILTGENNEN